MKNASQMFREVVVQYLACLEKNYTGYSSKNLPIEEENRVLYFSFSPSKLVFALCTRALANVFEKNEKKN